MKSQATTLKRRQQVADAMVTWGEPKPALGILSGAGAPSVVIAQQGSIYLDVSVDQPVMYVRGKSKWIKVPPS